MNGSIEGEPLAFAAPSGEGFADAVTLSWGDATSELFGFARIGVASGSSVSALGVLFSGSDVIESVAEGDLPLDSSDWSSVRAGPLEISAVPPDDPARSPDDPAPSPDDPAPSPRDRWRLVWDGAAELELRAFSPPLSMSGGGMEGRETVCRVSGTAGGRKVSALGQRGRSWGVADWDRIALARSLSAWWEDRAVVLSGIRPAKAKDHAREDVTAWVYEDGAGAAPVAEPRLSTTYDGEGRQLRAGLELFLTGDDDEFPRRVAGEVACGTSLDLGRLRLDCAFFHWRMDGGAGVGRYDVLRRA